MRNNLNITAVEGELELLALHVTSFFVFLFSQTQTDISLLYLAVDSIHTAVGRFRLPVHIVFY